jgi:hypothetical protein
MEYALERRHSQVAELLELAHIRIKLRYKRLEDDAFMVAEVECSQV